MPERIESDTSKPRSRIITEEPGNITGSCLVKSNGDKNRKQPDRDDINQVHPWCVLTKYNPRYVRLIPKADIQSVLDHFPSGIKIASTESFDSPRNGNVGNWE